MTDTATNPDALTVVDKFDLLDAKLNDELVERSEEIRCMLLALVSGMPVFFLGEPGIAKSMLVNRLFAYLADAKLFDILLTRFTEMPEVFGPTKLSGLKVDKFERARESYLSLADGAMLDEVFKAGSALLNALLWILNERKYRHGTEVVKVPLNFIACASNELPEDPSLAALYDRLTIRRQTLDIVDARAFRDMLQLELDENPDPILSWQEVLTAQAEAKTIDVPELVLDAIVGLRKSLKDKGILLSPRRYRQSISVLRAAAYLDGADQVDLDHLRVLENVYWTTPAQFKDVAKLVGGVADPLDTEITALIEAVESLNKELDELGNDEERQRVGDEINGKLRKAKTDLKRMQGQAGTSRRRLNRLKQAKKQLRGVAMRVLMEVYSFPEEEAKKYLAENDD